MGHQATRILPVLTILLLGSVSSCQFSTPDEASESQVPQSRELGLRLSEEAAARVGIATAAVDVQLISPVVRTTGYLVATPTCEVTVRATATGFVVPDDTADPIALGDTITTGQSLGRLHVFVSPLEEAQLVALKEEADVLIRQSLASHDAAQARFTRLQELGKSGTVAEKEMELAKEAMERSRASYEELRQQLPFLPGEPYERPLQLNPIPISAPSGGRVTQLHVRPWQFVIQGEPCWTISDWSQLWVRVPVFEGVLPDIEQTQPIRLSKPGLHKPLTAQPTGIPQPTREGRRTIDLLYEVPNNEATLRPGEAVSVELPTGKTVQQIVVPRSAVLWDGMGNAAVYVEEEPNVYRRQRIRVGRSLDNLMVVEHGLSERQTVVTVGAEALYGEEFKGQIQVLEDDD